jgi:NmrA-like family
MLVMCYCSVPPSDAVVQNQHLLGDAAKKAGVKLFLPSEFGFSTVGIEGGELETKSKFGTYLEEIGLPSLRIFVSQSSSIRFGERY